MSCGVTRQYFVLGNAVKFTETGEITLSVSNRNPGKEIQPVGCRLHFEVVDTGLGISREEQDKVFDAFFQTDRQGSSQQGTGLGLPISQKFADLMGGVLVVSSKVGKGASFTFDIPVGPANSADTESSQFRRRVIGIEDGQPVFRLLVVEDNENNRNLLVKLLHTVGFEVKEAFNGQDGIEIWQKWQPHLIWMDMRMPVMDGYEATSIIKSEMRSSTSGVDTKIIALTASAFEADRLEVIKHGCNDFLSKPFRESEIFEMVRKHLGVKYVFEGANEAQKPANADKEMSAQSLAAAMNDLPGEIVLRLEEAMELSNIDMMDQVIKDIRIKDNKLANGLARLVENFAYDQILELINRSRK